MKCRVIYIYLNVRQLGNIRDGIKDMSAWVISLV